MFVILLNMPPSMDLAVIGIRVQMLQGPSYYFYPPDTSFNNITADIWVRILNAGTIPIPPDTMDPNPTYPTIYLKVNNSFYSYTYTNVLYGGEVDSVKFSNISLIALNNITAYHNYLDDDYSNDTLKITYSTYMSDTILNFAIDTTGNAALGFGNVGNAHIAVRYDSLKVWPFVESVDSYYITGVIFYHCLLFSSNCPTGNTRVSLWRDDGTGKPDLNQEIIGKDTFIQGEGFYVVKLNQSIKLEQSILPFYVGRSWSNWDQNNILYPFALGDIQLPNYSALRRADAINAGAWEDISSYPPFVLGIIVQANSSNSKEIIIPSEARLFKSEFVMDGKLEFISPINRDTRLKIYSLDGSLVRDIKLIKGTRIVNVGKLNSGVYVYIVEGNKGRFIVR